jgi:hypothetical protein
MGYFLKNRQFQSGSTGMVIPTGSSATRPDAPVFGLIRYNTDIGLIEFFNGSIFQSVAAAGGVSYTVDTFTGDGVTVAFNMSVAVSQADEIIVFVGSLYQIPVTNYTVDGSVTITFTSAPPAGVPINVIHTSS